MEASKNTNDEKKFYFIDKNYLSINSNNKDISLFVIFL
ncbi:hypothetical protein SAMN05421593_0538 [Chryseobacterium culicis]|jgi:hypothetical protein|uniref:Uncharacterized protein n=1 Tax=Chryseobacterium culicis TaxID=680127 RepID=A0A1H6GWQ9_CHRCI|nr:hypothetical protein SAMN05421593_0538 [Chryseobacterium culicis]